MSTAVIDSIFKLNIVFLSRKLREIQINEDHLLFPQSEQDEDELIKNSLFSFLKKTLRGCKIRPNQRSFSVRLDSEEMVKGFAVEQIFQDSKWDQWFENHHGSIHREVRSRRRAITNIYQCRTQTHNGHTFLYVPFKKERIEGYQTTTILDLINSISSAVEAHRALSNLHPRVVNLMEKEIERREEERKRKLQQALERYQSAINQNLYKSAIELQTSSEPVDRLFASKFIAWAEENNVAPRFIPSITAKEVVAQRLKVMVLAPTGSEEDGWIVLPPFDTPEIPEGYEFQGWGDVTKVDYSHSRSKNGQSPIIVLDYIHAGINMEHWNHLLPENAHMIHEATIRLQAEALEEVEPWIEEERARFERAQEEEQKAQQDLTERFEQLTSSLAQQRDQESTRTRMFRAPESEGRPVQEPSEPGTPNPDLMSAIRQQFMATQADSPDIHRPDRFYVNYRALPIERYVVVEDGIARRFTSAYDAMSSAGVDEGEHDFYNYHEPTEVAETHDY